MAPSADPGGVWAPPVGERPLATLPVFSPPATPTPYKGHRPESASSVVSSGSSTRGGAGARGRSGPAVANRPGTAPSGGRENGCVNVRALTPKDAHARANSPGKSGHPAQCICEMCSCGRHRCPKHRTKMPFKGNSAYREDYPGHDAAAVRQASVPNRSSDDRLAGERPKFEGISTQNLDYRAPPNEALKAALRAPPQKTWVKPSTRLEGETSYNHDYTRKTADPNQFVQRARDTSAMTSENRPRFEGETSYRHDYYEKRVQREPPPPARAPPASRKFEGTSHSRDAFRPFDKQDYLYALQATASPVREQREPTRFEGQPSHRLDFCAPPRDAYKPADSARPVQTTTASRKFSGHTNYHDSYPAHDVAAMREAHGVSTKPEAGSKGRQEDRTFQTTATSDYKAPPPSRPCKAGQRIKEVSPPTPSSGREHVYFDEALHRWY